MEVDESTRAAYDRDAIGQGYHGILANDSLYYPELKCGDLIPFEMRGEKRPVADFSRFLSPLNRITSEEKAELTRQIAEHSEEG